MQDVIFLPFPRQLYEDVVRFSDGRLDLVDLAVDQFHDFIRRTADDNAHGVMGERLEEFLVIYHPDIIARWRNEELDTRGTDNKKNAPLIWKEVIVPAGSEVRMQYGGGYHLARVESGKIMDKDGHFSPSEWASRVADGTNRNAWRDLSFRLPGQRDWVAASTLRELKAKEYGDLDLGDILEGL